MIVKPALIFYGMFFVTTAALTCTFLYVFVYLFIVAHAAVVFANPVVGVPAIGVAALVTGVGLRTLGRAVDPTAWHQLAIRATHEEMEAAEQPIQQAQGQTKSRGRSLRTLRSQLTQQDALPEAK